ncbi:MAG: GNAT family N-acetyltransferase [Oscillospiraceae bacterium]|nr:GNAT family N-acetyltransferase [Oscillospiraceae bacterium]
MKNDILRHELNVLTQKTFGFDFENWVKGGYFEGDYIPYSFEEGGEIIANVSVNKMKFIQNGVRKNYIQIGTVMTDKPYRKQGLAKRLMEYVLKEYENKYDGIYLFANLNALPFYQKTGFKEGLQYQYALKKDWTKVLKKGNPFKSVDKQNKQIRLKYMDAVRNSAVNSALEQINKYSLQMFYTANLNNVYYADDIDCFIVMEKSDDVLMLQSVISKEHISLNDIITRIDIEYNQLKLGFSPCDDDIYMFEAFPYDGGDDYRLFYRGKELESIEKEKLFFPNLSHA